MKGWYQDTLSPLEMKCNRYFFASDFARELLAGLACNSLITVPVSKIEMNGAESLIRTLAAGGVDTCCSNPGTSEIQLVAALDGITETVAC